MIVILKFIGAMVSELCFFKKKMKKNKHGLICDNHLPLFCTLLFACSYFFHLESLEERLSVKTEISSYRRRSTAQPKPLHVNPTPFSSHGARYRHQNTNCQPDGIYTTHSLILDTSGSIGRTEFNRVTIYHTK